jgi:hypothetical protein
MAGRFFTWLEKKEKIACCTEEGNKGQHLYICPVQQLQKLNFLAEVLGGTQLPRDVKLVAVLTDVDLASKSNSNPSPSIGVSQRAAQKPSTPLESPYKQERKEQEAKKCSSGSSSSSTTQKSAEKKRKRGADDRRREVEAEKKEKKKEK